MPSFPKHRFQDICHGLGVRRAPLSLGKDARIQLFPRRLRSLVPQGPDWRPGGSRGKVGLRQTVAV